jgi:hypothetical protein
VGRRQLAVVLVLVIAIAVAVAVAAASRGAGKPSQPGPPAQPAVMRVGDDDANLMRRLQRDKLARSHK